LEGSGMTEQRPPLEEMTLRQLRRVASACEVSRYSRMVKVQLIEAIRSAESTRGLVNSSTSVEAQEMVEASKFGMAMPQSGLMSSVAKSGSLPLAMAELASVDQDLADLPGGYGDSRIVMLPRDPQWSYVYWDVPNEQRAVMRSQGGQQLALRLFDVTDIDLDRQAPHSIQEYGCDEMAREWYLPIPVSDRSYVAEIGYRCFDGRWLAMARSAKVHIPPVYPSEWIEDVFVTVGWESELRGQTVATLVSPAKRAAEVGTQIHEQVFAMAAGTESQRIAGSLYGSMPHVAGSIPAGSPHMLGGSESISSFVLPAGMGAWATTGWVMPTTSGMGLTGPALNMSGIGMGASQPPTIKPRNFWLVADAELIVYGATEPDATVTIGGKPIKLNSDGTFRFQMSFQDGLIDFPIMAVAVDGEQSRHVHMKFERETPARRTNTKAEAVDEWPG
jgi:uncharacterized protein